tara:strand:+ start:110 stop:412 length:303 start_codon:yes stop_codon:yes gene_type:complete
VRGKELSTHNTLENEMSKTRELYAPSDCDGQDLDRTPDEQSGIQQLLDDAEFLGAAYQEVMRMIREDRASLKQLETFVDEVIRDYEELQYSQPENEKPRG